MYVPLGCSWRWVAGIVFTLALLALLLWAFHRERGGRLADFSRPSPPTPAGAHSRCPASCEEGVATRRSHAECSATLHLIPAGALIVHRVVFRNTMTVPSPAGSLSQPLVESTVVSDVASPVEPDSSSEQKPSWRAEALPATAGSTQDPPVSVLASTKFDRPA